MADQHPGAERIEPSFRYGSAIMIGVIAGFSLAFLTNWAANPIPWGWNDLFGLVPLVFGVILELASVWMLLDHRSLELRRYQRAIRAFKTGVVLVGLGVTLAILVDFVFVTEHFSPGGGGTGH
jgi:hypothetical protein